MHYRKGKQEDILWGITSHSTLDTIQKCGCALHCPPQQAVGDQWRLRVRSLGRGASMNFNASSSIRTFTSAHFPKEHFQPGTSESCCIHFLWHIALLYSLHFQSSTKEWRGIWFLHNAYLWSVCMCITQDGDRKACIKVTESNTHLLCLTTGSSFLLSTLNICYPPTLFHLLL